MFLSPCSVFQFQMMLRGVRSPCSGVRCIYSRWTLSNRWMVVKRPAACPLSFMAFGSNDVHWRFSEEQWAKGRHLEKICDSASGLSLKKTKSRQKDSLSRNKCVVCAFHLCRGNVSVVLVCSHQLQPWNLIHEEHIFSIPRFNRHLSFVPEEWVVSTSLCIVKWSRGSGGQTHRRRSWHELENPGEKCAR